MTSGSSGSTIRTSMPSRDAGMPGACAPLRARIVRVPKSSCKQMHIRKAIFPVAGLGTRFLPATKAQPKEMLPIVDKPLVQYAVEEVACSGIAMVVFVTGRGKNAIEDHFDISFELEHQLAGRGKEEERKRVRSIAYLLQMTYI